MSFPLAEIQSDKPILAAQLDFIMAQNPSSKFGSMQGTWKDNTFKQEGKGWGG